MSLITKVDELFIQWDKPNSPGCAIAVIQSREIIYQRGYGMANLEYNIPISPNSVFDIASNSKQFTAICIVLLARQNFLNLDDELQKYIPEIPQYSQSITIRYLLDHTSGLRDYLALMSFAGMVFENKYSNEEIIALIARQKSLNFEPGTEQLYSNSGYILLAEIVRRVSGKSLRVFAQENIFAPLGMKNTHFHDNFKEIVKNRANGYAPKDGGSFQIDMSFHDFCGDGQLYTTIEDLLLWDRNFYHNILGGYGQDLIEEVTTPRKLNNGEVISGSFGLQIGNRGGLKTIRHGGAWTGYRSDFIRFPDRQFSVICLANLNTIDPTKLAFKIADIYLENDYIIDIVKPISRSINSINLPVVELQIKTGFYYNSTTGSIWELEIEDEKLMANLAGMHFPFVPIDTKHFQSADNEIDYDIEFSEDLTQIIVKVDIGNAIKISTLEKMLDSPKELLTDYLGTYYSTELESEFKIILASSILYLKSKGCSPSHLKVVGQDLFLTYLTYANINADKFEFVRDRDGQVVGLYRCNDRVRRLYFRRCINAG
ncbi:penicillin-binding protein [Nostoc sp. 'Peltigera membranacea cyanobiont' 213]|uniref:serine hydrolase domain-containing protein n=1 Tax=Nostoc sp. 'Peltigera membranacea cyanobiont' 213 TaxID=2014530 RepID=UPI000B9542B3|nr:serine hydrolase domain-containing protein [Nostoc sp. 'Peltigera membranacea cyanobiont' 213]OYD86823.1 penicillin-binding protein [Nostoc sp. 'Peltigera membranacea cyanobiont' 213]